MGMLDEYMNEDEEEDEDEGQLVCFHIQERSQQW